jgi:tripartite-type tricarboxylate transporter receptor subunit TctC
MVKRLIFTALACVAFSSAGLAQAWPSKPITFIVPAAAGSGPDVSLRLYTDRLSKVIGQPVIVKNVVGASGAIGAQAAAKSAPDGYTFFMGSNGHLVVNKYTMKNPGYDPDRDFMPVALLNRAPYMLLVNPSLPINSVAELGTYARSNPGKAFLAYEGSSVQAIAAYTKQVLSLSIDLVAYNSPLQAIQDTLGGSAQFHIQGTAIGLAFVTDQRLRALAVLAAERLPQLANVPTMNELYPNFGAFDAWLAIVAPAGTPPDIVKRMSAELHAIGSQDDLRAMFNKLGFFEETDRSPERTAAYIKSQTEQFAKMAAAADLKAE